MHLKSSDVLVLLILLNNSVLVVSGLLFITVRSLSVSGGDANDRTLYSEENRSGGFEYQIVNCPDFRLIVTLADNSATITEKQLISTKKTRRLIISGS